MSYDREKTVHRINGKDYEIQYLGNAEWVINGRIVIFSGFKEELIQSIKREPISR